MRYRRGSDVVYRNGWYLLVSVLAGVWCIVFSIVDGAGEWALLCLLVIPGLIYIELMLRVILRDSGLYIHAYRPAEHIQYEWIAAARFTGRYAGDRFLEIYLTDGSKVGVHPGRASFFPFHVPRWQRPLADEIMKRVERTRSHEDDRESPTERRDAAAGRMPWTQPGQDSTSDRKGQDRIRLVFAVSAGVTIWVLVVLLTMDRPLAFLGGCVWFAGAVLTVTLAVRYTWRRVLTRIPARFAESPSTAIRIATAVVKGLAVYLVGWLALAAALDVPTFIIQHF